MGNLTLNGQTVLTQVGTNRPEFGAGAPLGCIIKVEQALKTDVQTIPTPATFPTWEDIEGLSITFNPSSSSSRFFIQSSVMCSSSYWKVYVNLVRVVNGVTTELQLGDQRGTYRPRYRSGLVEKTFQDTHGPLQYIPHLYVDSPNTELSVTYKLQGSARVEGGGIMYINRSVPDRDASTGEYDTNGSSSLIIMEIAA